MASDVQPDGVSAPTCEASRQLNGIREDIVGIYGRAEEAGMNQCSRDLNPVAGEYFTGVCKASDTKRRLNWLIYSGARIVTVSEYMG